MEKPRQIIVKTVSARKFRGRGKTEVIILIVILVEPRYYAHPHHWAKMTLIPRWPYHLFFFAMETISEWKMQTIMSTR